jgi:hypothetical protein
MRMIGILLVMIIFLASLMMVTENSVTPTSTGKVVAEGKLLLKATTVKDFQSQRAQFEANVRPLLSSEQYLKTVDAAGTLVRFLDENISHGRMSVAFPSDLQVQFVSDLATIEQKNSATEEGSKAFYRFLGISIGLAFGILCLAMAEFEDYRAVRSIDDLPPRARRRSLAGALRALAALYREKNQEMDDYANKALSMTMKYNRLRIQAEDRIKPRQVWDQGRTGKFEWVSPDQSSRVGEGEDLAVSQPVTDTFKDANSLPLEPVAASRVDFHFFNSQENGAEIHSALPEIETTISERETPSPTEEERDFVLNTPSVEMTGVPEQLEEVSVEEFKVSQVGETATNTQAGVIVLESEKTDFSAHMAAFANRRSDLSELKGRPDYRTLQELKDYPETMIVVIEPNPEDVERMISISGVSRAQAAYNRIFDSLSRVMVRPHNIAFEDGRIYWYVPKAVVNSATTNVSLEEVQRLLEYEIREVDFKDGDPIFTDMEISYSQL